MEPLDFLHHNRESQARPQPAVGIDVARNLPHPLLRFWTQAYSRYERPLTLGLGFHVPELPAPLFSPNFPLASRETFLAMNRGLVSHFNEIVPLGHDQRGPAPSGFRLTKQFYLGARRVEPVPLFPGFSVEALPLAQALKGTELPTLITEGFPREAALLLRLQLPFLCTLDTAVFHAAFLKEQGHNIGVVLVGLSGGVAFVFQAVVRATERGRGLSRVLADVAQNLAFENNAEEAFYFTEHAFFGRHADSLEHYRIFEKT